MSATSKEPGCVLCRALEQDHADPSRGLVVFQSPLNFIVMNLFPYNAGHVMIATNRHVARLADATEDELADMMNLARRLEGVMTEAYRPDGINLGMNLGKPAGAGVADHIHLHIVPRWVGDTNFVTVLGETRVIPEDPLEACSRLRKHFGR